MPEAAPEPSAIAAVRRKRHTPAQAEQITHELTAASSDFNVSLDRFNPSRDRPSDAGDQPNNVAARLDDIVGKMDPLLSLVTSPLALAHRVVRHAHALGEPHVRRGGPEPTFSEPSLDADVAREALRARDREGVCPDHRAQLRGQAGLTGQQADARTMCDELDRHAPVRAAMSS